MALGPKEEILKINKNGTTLSDKVRPSYGVTVSDPIGESFEPPRMKIDSAKGIDGYLLTDTAPNIENENKFTVKKCFCMDCQKVFDVNKTYDGKIKKPNFETIQPELRTLMNNMSVTAFSGTQDSYYVDCYDPSSWKNDYETYTRTNIAAESIKNDPIVCPDCQKEMQKIGFIPLTHEDRVIRGKDGREKNANIAVWRLPTMPMERKVSVQRDEATKKPRIIEDTVSMKNTMVYPSGKMFSTTAECVRLIDMDKKSQKGILRLRNGSQAKNLSFIDAPDFYKKHYKKSKETQSRGLYAKHFERDTLLNSYGAFDMSYYENPQKCLSQPIAILNTKRTSATDYRCNWTQIGYKESVKPCSSEDGVFNVESKIQEYVNNVVATLVEENFHDQKDKDGFTYTDSTRSKLYTDISGKNYSDTITEKYTQMMVKYPAAFEYACQRAEMDVINDEYKKKRDGKESCTITEKGRMMFFRKEMLYVAQQLSTVDNNILKEISDSKDNVDMMIRLGKITFGADEWNNKIAPKLNLTEEATGYNGQQLIDVDHAHAESLEPTKRLINAFKTNPIGVANIVYTCQKMNVHDINHVNKLIQIADASPSFEAKKTKRCDGNIVYTLKEKSRGHINADTIAPVISNTDLEFIRNYVNTHSEKDLVDLFDDNDDVKNSEYAKKPYVPDKFALLNECMKMYSEVKSKGTLICGDTESPEGQADGAMMQHDIQKKNIESYLQYHPVEDAYVDYILAYGKKTPSTINSFIAEIKADRKMPELKESIAKNGIDATIERNQDIFKDMENPKAYLERQNKKTETPNSQPLSTRNGKPLFRRSLMEIHEELSIMNRHCVNENVPFENLPEDIKNMEKSYPATDGSGTWSFHVCKDSFDIVRTGTELSNCLGEHHVEAMHRNRAYILYMQDELKNRVAAIEIMPNGNPTDDEPKYRVTQFQSHNDTTLDERYSKVAIQWLEDMNISYENCSDVNRFGTNQAIYGNGGTDFHSKEVDDVLGTTMYKDKKAELDKKRKDMANMIYPKNPDGSYNFGVEIPEYEPYKEENISNKNVSKDVEIVSVNQTETIDNPENRYN